METMMTNMVDRGSFTQRVHKKMYPHTDEFLEWDKWDVFRDFMLVPRHPALYPTITRVINGVVYYAGMPMVASSQETDFSWTKRPVPSDGLKSLAELMDLRTNRQTVFTNLHKNVCGLLGVQKNFSELEAVNPHVSTYYTFPQTAVAELKNRFKSINHPKEKRSHEFN